MTITKAVQQKILVLDGAMGTMIQAYKFEEEDYRGDRFADYPYSLKGNNDLLVLTQPKAIDAIHLAYLEAGADILETNTFNSNSISMEDYHMSDLVVELNKAAVESARRAIDQYRANGGTEAKYIAGSVGPTNKTASLSPDVNNPGFRAVSFDDLRECYFEQCEALVEAGVDALLIETVFDTLNAKAALFAAQDAIEASGREVCDHAQRHHYGCFGTHPKRPDHGGLSNLCGACTFIEYRIELCLGCETIDAVPTDLRC